MRTTHLFVTRVIKEGDFAKAFAQRAENTARKSGK
jgi:hypothetical protein